jgi:transposase
MPRTRQPYPPEFGRQMVEPVRCGLSPGDLAKEFDASAQAIRNWSTQSDQDEAGVRADGSGRASGRSGLPAREGRS